MEKNRSEYNKKYWEKHKEGISEQRKGFYKDGNKEKKTINDLLQGFADDLAENSVKYRYGTINKSIGS